MFVMGYRDVCYLSFGLALTAGLLCDVRLTFGLRLSDSHHNDSGNLSPDSPKPTETYIHSNGTVDGEAIPPTETYIYSNGTVDGEAIPLAGAAARIFEDYHNHPSLEHLSHDGFVNLTLPTTEGGQRSILWPQPVTAADRRYFPRLMAHIRSKLDYIHPTQKLIIYDIGNNSTEQMTDEQKKEILALGRTETRILADVLPTEFPEHLLQGRRAGAWKMVIVELILSEFGAAMWMDASIELIRNVLPELEAFVGPTGALDGIIKRPDMGSGDTPFASLLSSARGGSNGTCFFYLVNPTFHSAYCATPENMSNYLPANPESLLGRQSQSGIFVVYNTDDCKRLLVEPALACSLYHDCIGPRTETSIKNLFGPTCHGSLAEQSRLFNRGDQSVLAILSANFFAPNPVARGQHFVKVARTPKVDQ